MWKRSIGIGLILFGAVGSVIPVKNLWTISAAWEDLERNSIGIEFLEVSGMPETLRNLV